MFPRVAIILFQCLSSLIHVNLVLASSTSTDTRSSQSHPLAFVVLGITLGFTIFIIVFGILIDSRRRRDPPPSPVTQQLPSNCVHCLDSCRCFRLRRTYDGIVREFNYLRLGILSLPNSTSINIDTSEVEKGFASQGARPGTSGSRDEPQASDECALVRPVQEDFKKRMRGWEDEYRRRRASCVSARSRKAVLAELDEDFGPHAKESGDVVPPLPIDFHLDAETDNENILEKNERTTRTRSMAFAVRKTVVEESKKAIVVKGKLATNIVAVKRNGSRDENLIADGTIAEKAREVVSLGAVGGLSPKFDEEGQYVEHMEAMSAVEEKNNRDSKESRNRGSEENEDVQILELEIWIKDYDDAEKLAEETMQQTRLLELRQRRRNKKRQDLATNNGSQDLMSFS